MVFGFLLRDSFAESRVRITFKVVDDDGKPAARFPVNASFEGGDGAKGLTDTNGLFAVEGQALFGIASYVLMKEGYYYGRGEYRFNGGIQNGEFQPWNPVVTTVVRRIMNPIPMYAKTVETKIPMTNVLFGFDLQSGDWVQPTGKGIITDLVFKIDGYWNSHRDNHSSLTVSFARTSDGLIPFDYEMNRGKPVGSVFVLPRIAPESGYEKNWTGKKARKSGDATERDQILDDLKVGRHYIIRIRSETNETGVVTNAWYGKVHGNFEFIGAGRNTEGSWLKFTYYLNPTPNDRNLEFDPKKNLFQNLKSTEQVTAP
jgi:hypothetical protein